MMCKGGAQSVPGLSEKMAAERSGHLASAWEGQDAVDCNRFCHVNLETYILFYIPDVNSEKFIETFIRGEFPDFT